jgi:hypothetical protein
MVYSFARVGAVMTMKVGDYFQHRKRWWLRLHEKGGKRHEVPAIRVSRKTLIRVRARLGSPRTRERRSFAAWPKAASLANGQSRFDVLHTVP